MELRFVPMPQSPAGYEPFPVVYVSVTTLGEVRVLTIVPDDMLAGQRLSGISSQEEFERTFLRRFLRLARWEALRRPELFGGATAYYGALSLVKVPLPVDGEVGLR